MSYQPQTGNQGLVLSTSDVGTRIKLITQINPEMAQRPDVLQAMATMPMTTEDMMANAGQTYGMMTANTLATDMGQMSGPAQRAFHAQLNPQQQMALASMGYQPPQRDEGSIFGDIVHVASAVISPLARGVGAIPGVKQAVGGAMEGLNWLGNWPGHLYRSIRMMGDTQQALGGIGAIIGGVGALALAPITGGASLAALGVFGAGALLGGTAAAAATAPGDWWSAFQSSWDGEKSFDRPSQRKARELLGDPRLTGLASDIVNSTDFDLASFAKELAGTANGGQPEQLKTIERLASKMGAQGTPTYTQAATAMSNAMQDATFQKAIAALQSGKMSPGRDLADQIPGLSANSPVYHVLSGVTDAAFQFAMDPTMLASEIVNTAKATKYSIKVVEAAGGGADLESFGQAARKVMELPNVRRVHDELVGIVNMSEGGMNRLRSKLPGMEQMYANLIDYKHQLAELGKLGPGGEFTREHLLDYATGSEGLEAMLKGVGTVRSHSGQLQLMSAGAIRMDVVREMRLQMRSLTSGMSDARTLRRLGDWAERAGEDVKNLLGPDGTDLVTDGGIVAKPWQVGEPGSRAYQIGLNSAGTTWIGRPIAKLGDVLTSITTMALAGHQVDLMGGNAVRDIRAMTESMRYLGMPSYARQAWSDAIMAADSGAQKLALSQGMVGSMMRLSGMDATDEGRKIISEFMEKSKQMYGTADEMIVNGHPMHVGMLLNDQATHVVFPDIHQLSRAVRRGMTAKVMGISDLPVIEAGLNKVWKPVLLLRLGFIPRAAGEELTAFLARGEMGSLTQERAGQWLGRREAYNVAMAKQAAITEGATIELTKDEKALVQQGWHALLPTHARPVARMMERLGYEEPAMQKLKAYGDWLDKRLRAGTGLIDHPINFVKRIAGDGTTYHELSTQAERGRQSIAKNLDSILLGNENSVRRMIGGGVNSDLINAGREWASSHSTTVMREASASEAGPFDPAYDQSNVYHEVRPDENGKLRNVTVRTVRGERRYIAQNDVHFQRALHDTLARRVFDPALRSTMLEHVARVRGDANVTERDLEPILERFTDMLNGTSKAVSRPTTKIMDQLIGNFSPERWHQMVADMQVYSPGVADVLRLLPADETHTYQSIVDHLARHVEDGRGGRNVPDVLKELQRHGQTFRYLDGLDPHSKAFAEQFLGTQLVGGHASWWNNYRRTKPEPGAKWLYDSMDEAAIPMRDSIKSTLLNPHTHQHGLPLSLRSREVDAEGRYIGQVKDNSVTLYGAPHLNDTTFEDVLANSSRPDLIRQHQDTVRYLTNWDQAQQPLVANFELAQELEAVRMRQAGLDPSLAPRPHLMRQPRDVVDGRIHELLTPIPSVRQDGKVALWGFPKRAAQDRLLPTPDELVDPLEAWANDLLADVNRTMTRHVDAHITSRTVAGEPLEDGTIPQLPVVHRFTNERRFDDFNQEVKPTVEETARGQLVPVGVNERLNLNERYVDRHGAEIGKGDPAYFHAHEDGAQWNDRGSMLWEGVGPLMRDMADEQHGALLMGRRRVSASLSGRGRAIQSAETAPLRRASHVDLNGIEAGDLPSFTLGNIYKEQKVGNWEKMVQFGFDRVIGPSIDAIVRKPMAFHAFAERYRTAQEYSKYLIDPVLIGKGEKLVDGLAHIGAGVSHSTEDLSQMIRDVAHFDGNANAKNWSMNEATAWFRSHTTDEAQDLIHRTLVNADGLHDAKSAKALVSARKLARLDPVKVSAALTKDGNVFDLLAHLESVLPPGTLRNAERFGHADIRQLIGDVPLAGTEQTVGAGGPVLAALDSIPGAWETLSALHNNIRHVNEMAGRTASIAAISDVVPFLDSHEFKTQFADYGKGMMPFWYAEENFMKRWARGLSQEGPAVIRRMQLTYMGLRHSGVVRTDAQGRDWFVYPGSGALAEALSKMTPGLGEIAKTGLMFQTPTDSILPGLNNRFGTPSFNPLVSIPLDLTEAMFGELQPLNRAILGDYAGAEKADLFSAIFPAHLRNLFDAVRGGDNNARYASAQMATIAHLEARGEGLPDNATPDQIEHFMDKVRQQARITVVTQALLGFAAPGPASAIMGNDPGNSLTLTDNPARVAQRTMGFHLDNPDEVLSDEYMRYLRLFGVEEGTNRYLHDNPEATLHGITKPLALTVPRNVSASGAPIPSTQEALDYYDANKNYMHDLPDAAPYLLPQMPGGTRSQYAYDQEVAAGLRVRRAPDDYLRAMKFKSAAPGYFAMRKDYLDQISLAQERGDKTKVTQLKTTMDAQLSIYRAANPIFTEELQSSDGRQRRQRAINQMRTLVEDPLAPDSEQLTPLRMAMKAFDTYQIRLKVLSSARTTMAKREVEHLKTQFSDYMDQLTVSHPGIMSFWIGALQPEASLD